MINEDITPVVEKAISGDPAAFDALFNTYWSMAYYYCCKYLKNYSDAEEVAQDSFFLLHRNIGNLQHPHLFKAYFFKILVNTCHNRTKSLLSRNTRLTVSVNELSGVLAEERIEFLPEATMIHQEMQEEIAQLISELPKKQREVMLLHTVQGLTQSEIAYVLDVKPGVVTNRLFNARANLKRKFEKKNGRGPIYPSFIPLPIIAHVLAEEMKTVAAPEVQARAWECLQNRMEANHAGSAAQKGPSPYSAATVGAIVTGCVAALCLVAVAGIILVNRLREPVPDALCTCGLPINTDAHAHTNALLEELRAATTLEDFDSFVERHGFEAGQVATINGGTGEIIYRLYKRAFCHIAIFAGIRIDVNGVLIFYETAEPGTPPPGDVTAWINDKMECSHLYPLCIL